MLLAPWIGRPLPTAVQAGDLPLEVFRKLDQRRSKVPIERMLCQQPATRGRIAKPGDVFLHARTATGHQMGSNLLLSQTPLGPRRRLPMVH